MVSAAVRGESGEEVQRRRGAGDTTGSHRKSSPKKFSGGGAGQWRLPEIKEEGERELGLSVLMLEAAVTIEMKVVLHGVAAGDDGGSSWLDKVTRRRRWCGVVAMEMADDRRC
ncbi:hypothetical protein Tco_1211412 [Tanacetum coccineum]